MKRDKAELLALDIFQELGNIGTGSAVTSLSNMIDVPIDERFPNVTRLVYDNLIDILGPDDERVLGFLFPISGEVAGLFLIIWKQEFVSEIFEALTGYGAELKELDEKKISIIKEIANIMTSSYFTAISSYTDKRIEIQAPAVSVDMAGAVVTDSAGLINDAGKDMVCIESGFLKSNHEEISHLCFMMDEKSAEGFLEALGGNV